MTDSFKTNDIQVSLPSTKSKFLGDSIFVLNCDQRKVSVHPRPLSLSAVLFEFLLLLRDSKSDSVVKFATVSCVKIISTTLVPSFYYRIYGSYDTASTQLKMTILDWSTGYRKSSFDKLVSRQELCDQNFILGLISEFNGVDEPVEAGDSVTLSKENPFLCQK